MMDWCDMYQAKLVSVETAAAKIVPGSRLAMTPGGSCPVDLVTAIAARREELRDVSIISGLLFTPLEHLKREFRGHLGHHSIFVGPLERFFLGEGNIEVTSYQFSHTDDLFDRVQERYDFGLFECSPPNEKGYMSLGPLGTFAGHALLRNCDCRIVQVNRNVPWIAGSHSHLHVSEADFICEADHSLPEAPYVKPGENELAIARLIIDEIPDGACLQVGVGKIPNAVCELLLSSDKRHLGVHTEMAVDAMVDLVHEGIITGERKNFHPGKMIVGAVVGTKKLYDFAHNNPMVEFHPISYVNSPLNVGKNDNFMAINSALTMDLTGQVCSETIGFSQYSGTGGQLDFVRGAHFSRGGKSFIALNSVAGQGKGNPRTRIVSALPAGTVVTTPRSDVDFVVTEYGIVNLKDQSIEKRVRRMISIAHPDFRDQLTREAVEAGLLRTPS